MARTTTQKTISLEPAVLRKGLARARARGFKKSFSAYVAQRIEEDEKQLVGAGAGNGKAVPA